MVTSCHICQEHRAAQVKESMISHPIPEYPWQVVGTDLFEWNKTQYLLIVDYHSRYTEIAQLSNTRASTVITHCKSVFARHGIPERVISDNGPQYSSNEFRQFAKQWGFRHQTNSPGYPQSNGLAERTVQTINLLKKSKVGGEDPYLALLASRNTPFEGQKSPMQLLINRRGRTTLPTATKMFKPRLTSPIKFLDTRKNEQAKQKRYYDRSAHPLSPMKSGDQVRIRQHNLWKPAVVLKPADSQRSYTVRTDEGGEYRRNRRHLRKSVTPSNTALMPLHQGRPFAPSPQPRDQVTQDDDPVTPEVVIPPLPSTPRVVPLHNLQPIPPVRPPSPPKPTTPPEPPAGGEPPPTVAQPQPMTTRSGRRVKPVVYKDFVKYK